MKKIVLIVMGLLFLSGFASAYQVNIDAPESLSIGKPLIVNGTTTFGIGMAIDVVLYYQLTTTTEIKRKTVHVQSDKTFRVVFDTTGLKKGIYKVEVPVNGQGDSVTMRLVQLIDRSDDIQLSSFTTQDFKGKISVAGTIRGDENTGVQIEVIGPDNTVVFGPRYVNINNAGSFSAEIPIPGPGDYELSFTDAKGFIGTRMITAAGQPTMEATPVATATTYAVFSAHAKASRDNPAYFVVRTASGPVVLHTSSAIDWVIEYTDDKGALHVENNYGALIPERAEFQGRGKTVYVKVYPYAYSDSSEVFLYAENVNSIVVSPTVPQVFAPVPPAPAETQKSPVMPVLGLIALGMTFLLWRK